MREDTDHDDLTPREEEVRELVERGLTNEEIAARLGISVPGVKYHVSQILSKLGVTSRHEIGGGRNRAGMIWRWGLGIGAVALGIGLVGLSVGVLLSGSQDGENRAVHVDSISPSSGAIGTEVVIRGRGFSLEDNDVSFTPASTDVEFYRTAYQTHIQSEDGETLRFELEDTLGACPESQTGGCDDIGYPLPLGELVIAVHNGNGTSNEIGFNRVRSSIEITEEAVNQSPAYGALLETLDEALRAGADSYSLGFRQSENGDVYIQVSVHGNVPEDVLAGIPNEIAGYEVRIE